MAPGKIDLSRSNFNGAKLIGADLSKGEFNRCEFRDADLSSANLRLSSLARSVLTGAKLTGADFTDAYLYKTGIAGADLSGVVGLQQEQLDSACGDQATKLPAGLKASPRWPCEE